MGARVTKNKSIESQVCGKVYKLIGDIYIDDNDGHNFKHDSYYINNLTGWTNCPRDSFIYVKNVFSGNNIPDGGPFVNITGTIMTNSKCYDGVILDNLFDEDKNGKFYPKLDKIITTGDGFNFDSTVIPIPQSERIDLLLTLKLLICMFNSAIKVGMDNKLYSPRILNLLNNHPEDMSTFKYFKLLYGEESNVSEESLKSEISTLLNKEFGTLSDRNVHELIQEIYCNVDKVPFDPSVLKYGSEII